MSMEEKHEIRETLGAATRDEGGDLRDRVREVVLQAILRRQPDPQALREVMRDAVAGVGDGLASRGGQVGDALREAVQGLDEAIGKSVYALQMAVEESWGRGRTFAEGDLREAADAVKGLEDDLLGTLKETADRAQGGLRNEFEALGTHLRNNGTDTGQRVRAILEVLQNRLGSAASGAPQEAKHTAHAAAGRLADVASGILRGLADAIDIKRG
jgi:hypothetical protein